MFISFFVLSCNDKTRSLNLIVNNQTTDTIWINYYKLETVNYSCCYYTDTVDFCIPPQGSERMFELIVKDNRQYYTDDWFYLYRIYINSVLNEDSGFITIDPNVSHYWNYLKTNDETSYSIELTDSLF